MFFKGKKDVYIPLSGHALIILGGPSPWYILGTKRSSVLSFMFPGKNENGA